MHYNLHFSRTCAFLASNTAADAECSCCVHESNEQEHTLSVNLPFVFYTNPFMPPKLSRVQDSAGNLLPSPVHQVLPIMQQPAGPLLVPLLAVASSSSLQPFSSFSAPPPRHPVRSERVL